MSAERERRDELAVIFSNLTRGRVHAWARCGTRAALCAGLLTVVAGCGESDDGLPFTIPPIVAESRYIRLATDSERAICGGTLAGLDRRIESMYAAIEEPPPEGLLATYIWTQSPEEQIEYCQAGRPCTIFTDPPVMVDHMLENPHELAHAVQAQALGNSHELLSEGFAQVYGDPYAFWDPAETTIDVLRVLGRENYWHDIVYPTSGLFVSATIRRHGVGKFKELFRRVPYKTSVEEFRVTYESVFGESLDHAIDEVMATTGQPLVVAPTCEDAPVPWSGDVWRLAVELQCDSATGIGPGFGWTDDTVARRFALDLPQDGWYEFSSAWKDSGPDNDPFSGWLFSCDPNIRPQLEIFRMDDSHTGEFAAGRYYLEIKSARAREIEVTARYLGTEPPP